MKNFVLLLLLLSILFPKESIEFKIPTEKSNDFKLVSKHNSHSRLEGDINLDNLVNILDIMLLIEFILNDEYNEEADFNNDEVLNIIDIYFILEIIIESEN